MISYKKLIVLSPFFVCAQYFSQIIIGNATGTAPAGSKASVLLEFANTNNKGIIIPYVRTLPSTPVEGTILLDATNPAAARVKVYNGNTAPGTNGWTDLSGQNADITAIMATQPTGITEGASKTIIGSDITTADGALVLESATKAMILPIVTDTNNIPSPSPGMMVYINRAGAKRLAVYNGSKWSYWQE